MTILYRGLKLRQSDLNLYQPGETINLIGYTSTSKQYKTAVKFAYSDLMDEFVPVVFEIEFHGQQGLFELSS